METRAYKGPVPARGADGGAEPKQNEGAVCTERGGRALKRDSSHRAGARRRDRASAIQEAETCVKQPKTVSDCNQAEGCPVDQLGVAEPKEGGKGIHAEEHPGMGRRQCEKGIYLGELEVPDWRDW